jgi:hypothetical protein
MRNLSAGLMVVALLAVAAPAMADDGNADPNGLAASGAVIPYVGEGDIEPGSLSLLEISSPVGDNAGLHMLFFDASCARQGPSYPNPLTTNDVDVRRVDNLFEVPPDGLITIGNAPLGIEFPLAPLKSPIHLRMLWANAAGDYIRVLEPIQASNYLTNQGNFNSPQSWSPLKTGATYWAPPEIEGLLKTTLYLICPSASITRSGANANLSAMPEPPFPFLDPPAVVPAKLRVLIFDAEENPLRDTTIECTCLTKIELSKFPGASDVYTTHETYTKIFGVEHKGAVNAVCDPSQVECPGSSMCPVVSANPVCHQKLVSPGTPAVDVYHAFTGYKALQILPPNGLDAFHRLNDANGCDLFPDFTDACLSRELPR